LRWWSRFDRAGSHQACPGGIRAHACRDRRSLVADGSAGGCPRGDPRSRRFTGLRRICPSGKSVFAISEMIGLVQTGLQKYFSFHFSEIDINLLHPASPEGRTRRHEREAGCDGRGLCRATSGMNADGGGVWSWRPWAGAKCADDDPCTTVTMRSRTPGRARTTPLTPSRREGRECRLNLWLLTRVLSCCTRGCGCSQHPAFPAPSVFRGRGSSKTRARRVARMPCVVSDKRAPVCRVGRAKRAHRCQYC
jgi:hypothetical protein